jgi:transcriptional antiterminator RfaH
MTAEAATCWYVVHTQPHAEDKARVHLARQGFTTYLPRCLKRRRHARRVQIVPAPYFPRYLFITIDMATQRWSSIQSTMGVSRLVCNGDQPASVPVAVIDQLKQNEDEHGFIPVKRPPFKPGSRIKVLDGAFSDCIGIFEAETSDARVAILLELLGRKVRVSLESDLISAA